MFSYVGDTTIQGKIAKKLDVKRVIYLGDMGELRSEEPHIGMEYLHNSNDSIFFLDNGTFNFMYRFNAQMNDTITLSNSRAGCNGDPNFPNSGQAVVDTFFQRTYGGLVFDVYQASPLGAFNISAVIKGIGAFLCPFPQISPASISGCSSRFTEYGGYYLGLMCYSDSLRGELNISPSGYTCGDLKTAIDQELKATPALLLYPNPVTAVLHLAGLPAQALRYSIFGLNGQLVQQGGLSSDAAIEVSLLTEGLYFLSIETRPGKVYFSKFLKQQP